MTLGRRRAVVRMLAAGAAFVALVACSRSPDLAAPSPTVATPSQAPTPSPSPVPTPAGAFDVRRALDHTRVLSVEIGVREAGTPGDGRASKYIAGQLAAMGLRVERRPFPLPQGGESTNVVGVPTGFDERRPYLLLGGHYDSLVGPGANDNATGTSAVIETTRAVLARSTALPVLVVLFGAEERQRTAPGRPHHIGSRHYVREMSPDARRNLVGFVNVDMVGRGKAIYCVRMRIGPREATDRCLRQGARARILSVLRVQGDVSDHGSFLREGMNAVTLWSGSDSCCMHTRRDTFDRVQREPVDAAGRLALAILRSYERPE